MLHHPFKVTLFHYTVPNWSHYKPLLLNKIPPYKRGGDTVSTDFLHQEKDSNGRCIGAYFDLFDEFIKQPLEQFFQDTGQPIFIRNVWTQRARKGDYHVPHNHGSNGYAAVLYADYDPDIHSATSFMCPYTQFFTGDHMEFNPNVKEGDIIFFPSQLLHYANPNTSDKERVILSFNMMSRNEIDIYRMG